MLYQILFECDLAGKGSPDKDCYSKKTTHNFTVLTQILTNASGSIEGIARIDFLWLADAWCKD